VQTSAEKKTTLNISHTFFFGVAAANVNWYRTV